MLVSQSFVTNLVCTRCDRKFDHNKPHNLCECGGPLFVNYHLPLIRKSIEKSILVTREKSLWRYRELLPVQSDQFPISLGEGFTSLIRAEQLGKTVGLKNLWIKDESANPTGSFKARGLAVAITKAKEFGIEKIALPSAGNAGVAASTYASRAGLKAFVFMPADTPPPFIEECKTCGATVELIGGSIIAAGQQMYKSWKHDWFDLSTLKEPYRVEGKKTLGFELAEQLNWELPDWIIYPTGGGTGLVGMWKAFGEMEKLGWISKKWPKMVAVQPEMCAPVVKAFHEGKQQSDEWPNPRTRALGLRVPRAVGDFLMLKVLRGSQGTAVEVSETEIEQGVNILAQSEGIFACPESGAAVAGLQRLVKKKVIDQTEKVVVVNTGSGLKYIC